MPDLEAIATLLRRHRFHYSSERELQDGIERVIMGAGLAYRREPALSPRDRPDFLVEDIAIEVKVGGNAEALHRQIERYAEHPEVEAVLVVTTHMRHRAIHGELAGKPVRVLHLDGSVL